MLSQEMVIKNICFFFIFKVISHMALKIFDRNYMFQLNIKAKNVICFTKKAGVTMDKDVNIFIMKFVKNKVFLLLTLI